MTKQEEIREGVEKLICGECVSYSEYPNMGELPDVTAMQDRCREVAICAYCSDLVDAMWKYLHSQGAELKVECPDCEWSQFKDGESVGMTPCLRCGSTGYITEPLKR